MTHKLISRICLLLIALFSLALAPPIARAHQVNLSWTANAAGDNVTEYHVWIAMGTCNPLPGDWILIATIAPSAAPVYSDDPAKAGIYDYCVTAVNSAGESTISVDVCVIDTMSGRESAQPGRV